MVTMALAVEKTVWSPYCPVAVAVLLVVWATILLHV